MPIDKIWGNLMKGQKYMILVLACALLVTLVLWNSARQEADFSKEIEAEIGLTAGAGLETAICEIIVQADPENEKTIQLLSAKDGRLYYLQSNKTGSHWSVQTLELFDE